jgi:hypothetical protein
VDPQDTNFIFLSLYKFCFTYQWKSNLSEKKWQGSNERDGTRQLDNLLLLECSFPAFILVLVPILMNIPLSWCIFSQVNERTLAFFFYFKDEFVPING